MLRLIEDVLEPSNAKEVKGHGWLPARPVSPSFLYRLSDAWAVLIGRAEAVRWPEQESE